MKTRLCNPAVLRAAGAALLLCLSASVARAQVPPAMQEVQVPALQTMFDQLGGLGRLVKGKTVAIKINLTGAPTYRIGHLPLEETHYTNQHVIAATVHLMGKAGARRIRLPRGKVRTGPGRCDTGHQQGPQRR